MLQEIQEQDFVYIHGSAIKKYFLIIYNELKDQQKELGLDKFYFDDSFCWRRDITGVSQDKLLKMTTGADYYGYIYDIYSDLDKEKYRGFIKYIKNKYSDKYSWCKDKFTIESKVKIILNKLRPTEETHQKLKKICEEQKRKELAQYKKIEKTPEEIDAGLFEGYLESKKYGGTENSGIPKIPESQLKIQKNAFIYGIEVDGELVYIGKTYRPLKERIGEHIECVLDTSIVNSQQNYLYKAMRECKIGYKFKILYESHDRISNRDLEDIERAMLGIIKPKFNYEGVKVPYRYSSEK